MSGRWLVNPYPAKQVTPKLSAVAAGVRIALYMERMKTLRRRLRA